MNIKQEVKEAFEKAIYQGRLSRNPEAENFAGNYMYMGKSVNGQYDSFKNSLTRQYDV